MRDPVYVCRRPARGDRARPLLPALALLLVAAASGLAANFVNPQRQWTRFRGSGTVDAGMAVAADPAGGAALAGVTYGAFDGQTNSGGTDLFVSRFDNAGNPIWTRVWGSAGDDEGRGVAFLAPGGPALVAGTTAGAFDGETNHGGQDACLSLFSVGGDRLWSRVWGSASNDEGRAVAIQMPAYPCVAGFTEGAFDGEINAGGRDAFLTSFDGGGTRLWTRIWGSPAQDEAHALWVDASGYRYVAGTTWGAFDGQTNAGMSDLFLSCFDVAGNRQWTRVWGSVTNEEGMGVTGDLAGNVYVAGATLGAWDGESNAGGWDLCLTKFDAAGNRQWTRVWGSSADEDAYSVAVGGVDNFFVSGGTLGAFDGQTNAGSVDMCLSLVDGSGTRRWTRIWGSPAQDEAGQVSADGFGNPFVGGYSAGAFDGQGNAGLTDAVLSRWRNVAPPPDLRPVPGGGQSDGPAHSFLMDRFEVRNDQFVRFLNDAKANPGTPRGTNMFFTPAGDVFMDPAASPAEKLFSIGNMTAGTQTGLFFTNGLYEAVLGKENHPVVGVSWFGALKYCNWLTLDLGAGLSNRCYTEGQDPAAWHPVTATNWPAFDADARQALVDGYGGFRLPMDEYTGTAATFNEFYKAAAWNVEMNSEYGFGRNSIAAEDANYDNALWPTKTTPVGYYNGGTFTLSSNLTVDTSNLYGLYDLSGNAAEWSTDTFMAGDPASRAVRGGEWSSPQESVACFSSFGVAPETTDDTIGFRVVQVVPSTNPVLCEVVVAGVPAAFDTPWPFVYGTNVVPAGTVATNTVDAYVPFSAGVRVYCSGWELTDGGPFFTNGTGPEVVVSVTTNLWLNWFWEDRYEVLVTAGTGGTVNSNAVNGWYAYMTTVTNIQALPSGGYHFAGWTGDVPPAYTNDNPLTLYLSSGPAYVHANFAPDALGAVDRVLPAAGPQAGGNVVTIQGPALGDGADITNVTLCGVAAARLSQNPTQVVVRAGAALDAGPGDVVVHSASLGASALALGYTYNPAGHIFGDTYVWAERRPAGNVDVMWRSVSSSADGRRLLAGVYSGRLYTSADFGASWVERQPAGNVSRPWFTTASSGDGRRLLAGMFGGRLYTSADFGANWFERQPAGPTDQNWHAAAASADGQGLLIGVAGAPGGRLYTSADGGAGWDERQPAGNTNHTWGAAAMSADGQRVLAGVDGQRLYTSADGGIDWVERQPAGNVDRNWRLAASSADGANLFAGTAYALGRLYGSADGGASWVERQPAGNSNLDWRAVCCSADGRRALAVVYSGRAYLSLDGGAAWREEQPAGNVNGGWWTCAASEDGRQFVVADGFRRLYTGTAVGGVTPNSGPQSGSNVVAIAGSHLGSGTDVTNVTLCGVAVLAIVSQTPTQVVVVAAPASGAGLGAVAVHSVAYGTTVATNAYRYLLVAPRNVQATDGAYTNRIVVTWNALAGATGYGVWRNTTNNLGTATHVSAGADPVTNRYIHYGAAPSQRFYYWVRGKQGTNYGPVSAGDAGFAAAGASQFFYEAWGSNGVHTIWRCRADGSDETPVFTDATNRYRPAVSPNAAELAYIRWHGVTSSVCVASIDGVGERVLAVSTTQFGFASVNWHPGGNQLVYIERTYNGTPMGHPGERDGYVYRINRNGSGRVQVVADVDYDKHYASYSPDGGTLAFARNETIWYAFPQNLFLVDADGANERKITYHGNAENLKVFACHFAPDGRRIVYQRGYTSGGNSQLWIVNADGSGNGMIVDATFSNEGPAFTRDGATIVFARNTGSRWTLYTANPDGSGVAALPLSPLLNRVYPCHAIAGDALLRGGKIRCLLQPPGAAAAGAQWRLTTGADTNWHASGQASAWLPIAPYTVTFRALPGWTRPANRANVTPVRGGTNTISAVYVPLGRIRAVIQPSGAVTAGALWRLTTGADTNWHASGQASAWLLPGAYTVTFLPVPGWTAPADLSGVPAPVGGTNTVTGRYVQHGRIRCLLQPPAAVAGGARWRLTAGPDTAWHSSGQTSAWLPPAAYTVTFRTIPGWVRPANVAGVVPPVGGTRLVGGVYELSGTVRVPGSTFQMGIYAGQGGHSVTLDDFVLDRREVTVGEFRGFCSATDRPMPPAPAWGWSNTNLPMVNVTWGEAAAYAAWAGKRLPTEAEFECAMRDGRADDLYPWGDTISSNNANYGLTIGRPTVAGTYAATASYGLHDIAGNVWEWCGDWYAEFLPGAVTNPQGPATGTEKVVRSGSWANPASKLRCAVRHRLDPAARYADLGFRCATPPANDAATEDGAGFHRLSVEE